MTKKERDIYRKYMATGLYFVTCIGLSKKSGHYTDRRCWGWYKSLFQAIKAVERNYSDIYECGYYPYAVIEKVPQGLLPMSEVVQWFVWKGTEDKGRYKKCKEPEWARHTVNWSIG